MPDRPCSVIQRLRSPSLRVVSYCTVATKHQNRSLLYIPRTIHHKPERRCFNPAQGRRRLRAKDKGWSSHTTFPQFPCTSKAFIQVIRPCKLAVQQCEGLALLLRYSINVGLRRIEWIDRTSARVDSIPCGRSNVGLGLFLTTPKDVGNN